MGMVSLHDMHKQLGVLALLILACMSTGCRTVFVHPDATQEKYTADFYRCRFGTEPPTQEEIHRGDLPTLNPRRDWKHCMALLGWTTKVGMRWSPPYSR